jgi:hypothetical protein
MGIHAPLKGITPSAHQKGPADHADGDHRLAWPTSICTHPIVMRSQLPQGVTLARLDLAADPNPPPG